MTCEFSFDDGAYVLGALGPAERAAFERHLPTCATCRESVANLAGLPGLLGRLDAATAIPAVAAPPSLLRRTIVAATARRRADRRRRIGYAFAGGLAAIVLAAGVGVSVHALDATGPLPQKPALVAMRPVSSNVPVTAQIALVPTEGGTLIEMDCSYKETQSDGKWMIRLVVYARWGGTGEQIGTWTAESGQDLSLSGITHLQSADIQRVELQRADTTAMLTWTPA